MISQPRGFKRKVTYSNLPLRLRERLDTIAAVNDVRRSFVITTLIAQATNMKGEGFDYEDYIKPNKRINRHWSHGQIRRVK